MWEKLKHKILQVTEVAGVELITKHNGSLSANAVLVSLDKKEIIKKNEWKNLNNIGELNGKLSAKTAVTLIITGKNVLVKAIEPRENIQNYVAEIFPQANPNEFYSSILKQKDKILVAVTRKEFVDTAIDELALQGYRVIDFSLSFFDIVAILPYLNNDVSGSIETPVYTIQYDTKFSIQSFETSNSKIFDHFTEKEYSFANQYLKASTVLPFAAACRLIAGSITSRPEINNEKVLLQREEFKYFKYFIAASWAVLVGFFTLLLINFIFYNYYFNKNKELAVLQTLSEDQGEKFKKQTLAIKHKEAFLKETGWIKASKTSYFADRIASLVPSDIYLTALHFYPPNNASLLEKKETPFKKDTIQITGNCQDPVGLNQFTNNLKNLSEIKDVVVKNYVYTKETEKAIFLIEIITK